MKTQNHPLTRVSWITAFAAAALISTSSINAQTTPPADPPAAAGQGQQGGGKQKGGKQKGDRKDRAEKMKTELGLSDDQASQVETIMKERMEAEKSVREDATMSQDEKKAKMKENRDKYDAKIDAILTPEQIAKRDEMKKNHKGKKGGAGGPPPAN